MSTQLLPAPAGVGPAGGQPKRAGTDDRCTWRDALNVRCGEAATDTVYGELYCSVHADLVAGI